MSEVLVVANETIGGRRLRDAVLQKAKIYGSINVRLVIPRSHPRHGSVDYGEAVRAASQVRLDLALSILDEEGIEATGRVGEPLSIRSSPRWTRSAIARPTR